MNIHPLLCKTCSMIPCDQIPNFFDSIVFRISKFIKLLQLTRKKLGKNKEIEQGYPERVLKFNSSYLNATSFPQYTLKVETLKLVWF